MSPDIKKPEQENEIDPRFVKQTYELARLFYLATSDSVKSDQKVMVGPELFIPQPSANTYQMITHNIHYDRDSERIVFTTWKDTFVDNNSKFDSLPSEGIKRTAQKPTKLETNTIVIDSSGKVSIQKEDGSNDYLQTFSALNAKLLREWNELIATQPDILIKMPEIARSLRQSLLDRISDNLITNKEIADHPEIEINIGQKFNPTEQEYNFILNFSKTGIAHGDTTTIEETSIYADTQHLPDFPQINTSGVEDTADEIMQIANTDGLRNVLVEDIRQEFIAELLNISMLNALNQWLTGNTANEIVSLIMTNDFVLTSQEEDIYYGNIRRITIKDKAYEFVSSRKPNVDTIVQNSRSDEDIIPTKEEMLFLLKYATPPFPTKKQK